MKQESSHKQIFKSTAIIGASQGIVIILGILRTKVLAVLLGPVGVGIAGVYQVMIDLIKNVTGLGIGFSAVKVIAQVAVADDKIPISKAVLILKRWMWFTGVLGMCIAAIFAKQISQYTF